MKVTSHKPPPVEKTYDITGLTQREASWLLSVLGNVHAQDQTDVFGGWTDTIYHQLFVEGANEYKFRVRVEPETKLLRTESVAL